MNRKLRYLLGSMSLAFFASGSFFLSEMGGANLGFQTMAQVQSSLTTCKGRADETGRDYSRGNFSSEALTPAFMKNTEKCLNEASGSALGLANAPDFLVKGLSNLSQSLIGFHNSVTRSIMLSSKKQIDISEIIEEFDHTFDGAIKNLQTAKLQYSKQGQLSSNLPVLASGAGFAISLLFLVVSGVLSQIKNREKKRKSELLAREYLNVKEIYGNRGNVETLISSSLDGVGLKWGNKLFQDYLGYIKKEYKTDIKFEEVERMARKNLNANISEAKKHYAAPVKEAGVFAGLSKRAEKMSASKATESALKPIESRNDFIENNKILKERDFGAIMEDFVISFSQSGFFQDVKLSLDLEEGILLNASSYKLKSFLKDVVWQGACSARKLKGEKNLLLSAFYEGPKLCLEILAHNGDTSNKTALVGKTSRYNPNKSFERRSDPKDYLYFSPIRKQGEVVAYKAKILINNEIRPSVSFDRQVAVH